MADRYFGINPGETLVTRSASSTSKNLEVVVLDAGDLTKMDAITLLDRVKKSILEDTSFPDSV